MLTDNGGQFALAVKNWQEPFVHKCLKVTEDQCIYIALNFILFTESSVAALKLIPPGVFPEHRLKCTDGGCRAVKGNCTNSFLELGVVCKKYEDLYNECSICNSLSTLCTNMQETTQLPNILSTPDDQRELESISTDNSTTFIAGISVLVALLLA